MSQWFDVWDIKKSEEQENLMIPGLQESIKDITDIIEEEAEIFAMDKIILGGISQGCATVILTLLSSRLTLGGFVGLSSWLPFQKDIGNLDTILKLPQEDTKADNLDKALSSLSIQRGTPVLFTHSKDDENVPFAHGEALQEMIKQQGFDVTWKEYEDGGHWIHSKHGVDDISEFLLRCMDESS